MKTLLLILELLGALGVFLVGMKMMSEGLQKVAGAQLKKMIRTVTGNRFSGVLTGLAVTCAVQSSSAATVMVVSFVTAGLLTLTQAIGVIMGANIGTTVTGWLVALLGFKVKITAFALPAVGFGFGMTFLRGARRKQIGETLIGFGLLFLGLSLLKSAVPDVEGEQLAWVARFSDGSFLSMIIFVGIGSVLTVLLQSSSATMTLTLTLAALGVLPYELAAAMVLGENIGTTATANLAAIGGPAAAVRAARAHFIFNMVGASWAIMLMSIFLLPAVDQIIPGNPRMDFTALQDDPDALGTARTIVTTHLAAFHTLFNVLNTALMLPLVGHLERLVTRWVPDRDEVSASKYLVPALVETPELLLIQVSREIERMTEIAAAMFEDVQHILMNPEESLGSMVEDILEREDLLDKLEIEVSSYLTRVARAATSAVAARKIVELASNSHKLERIGDHCAVLVRIAVRLRSKDSPLSEKERARVARMGAAVTESLENLKSYLASGGAIQHAEEIEDRIDALRRELRGQEIDRLKEGDREQVRTSLALLDVFTEMEGIGDRAVSIVRRSEVTGKL
jgi:phosphate:Na+ symporter